MQQPLGVQLAHLVVAREVQLVIGGATTLLTSRDPELTLTVPPSVARFVAHGADGDIKVHAQWRAEASPVHGRLLFDSGGLWQLHDTGGQLAWSFTSPKFGPTPYKTAIFERDFSAGEVYLHRPYFDVSAPIYPMEYPLDELVLTNWLSQGRGIEIHGCAVRDADGAGYLFAGHSGAGKTTIARLWKDLPNVTVLSDDRVILRQSGGQIWMYGTPWHGDEPLASPSRVPLTQGFVLRHADRNERRDLEGADVIAKLLACSFPPFFSADSLDFSLSFLNDVTKSAPFADLGFLPDPSLLAFVRQRYSVVSVNKPG